ncbi:MAG TPA: LysR family transcriptional regulator [Gaiellaceae bacterium]|jgi:DNA-binding transcriptional LysR family regulator|nr:LysR family transcriptional regulator [Gaiellaceae bacterium]
MLLNQIAAFVETARRQSVSRAADALFISQPALTARLKGLEADLGAQLFVRGPRGMRLTDAGSAFLPYAVRSLETLTDGRMQVNALERGGAGRLAIGAAPAVSTYVLPPLLKRFSEGYPRVLVSVRTGHSEEILDLVLREQVTVGLVRVLQHPDIVSTPLYEDRLILVVEPGHRFATDGRIRMKELADEQLIQFDRTSSYHDLTSALFVTAGVSPAGRMELDNIDAAKKMVEQGFGVALLPQTSVADELEAGTLAEVEVVDASPVRRKIVAITRRDAGPPAGQAKAFLATFEEIRDELTSWPRPPAAKPRRAAGRPAPSRAQARGRRR